MQHPTRAPRWWRRLALAAAVVAAGLCLLVVALWIERETPLTLPAPTGPLAVGRLVEHWTGQPNRELLVWIWYPASARGDGRDVTGDYLPAFVRNGIGSPRGLLPFLTRDAAKVRSYAAADAPVSPAHPSYPVLLMRGGASTASVTYSTLAEDLASHGYVVVGIDAPYRTGVVVFPDGRVIRRSPENDAESCSGNPACVARLLAAWVDDMRFVMDRLEQLNRSDPSGTFNGRLDLTRVGAFGHSFGGAQALQFCHDDPRCRAAVDVDGIPFGTVVREGLQRPVMFLFSGDNADASDPESQRIKAEVRSIYDRAPTGARWIMQIRGANHFLFSDDGALLKSRIFIRFLRLLHVIRIDGRRQLAVTASCVRTFFDAYVGSAPQSSVRFDTARYPELAVLDW